MSSGWNVRRFSSRMSSGSGGRTSSPEKTERCCGASPGAVPCQCQPHRVALWLQQLDPCHVHCTHSVIPLPSAALTWLPPSSLLTSSELRQTSAIFFFFFFFLFFFFKRGVLQILSRCSCCHARLMDEERNDGPELVCASTARGRRWTVKV